MFEFQTLIVKDSQGNMLLPDRKIDDCDCFKPLSSKTVREIKKNPYLREKSKSFKPLSSKTVREMEVAVATFQTYFDEFQTLIVKDSQGNSLDEYFQPVWAEDGVSNPYRQRQSGKSGKEAENDE